MSSDCNDLTITLHQAAELLGVTPTVLRRWSDMRFVPHTRTAGGHRRYMLSDLQKYKDEIQVVLNLRKYRRDERASA